METLTDAAQVLARATRMWELRFVGLPAGPNHRLHWYTLAKYTKAWRQAAQLLALSERIPALERIRVSAVIYRKRLGIADEDNDRARLKPLVDGVVDAGVVKRDTRGHVTWGTVTEEHGAPGVLLRIEEVE